MSSKEIRAGRAFVEVSVRDKLAQGLRGAWAKLKAFATMAKSVMAGIGVAFAIAGTATAGLLRAIVGLTHHFADMGSELNDMAGRTGATVAQLSELKFAAEQTGASLADIETALKFMAKKGIGADKFDELAKAIAEIKDPTERAATAMQLFGRSGTKLLPMLAEFNELKARASELGLIIGPGAAANADALGDKFSELLAVWKRLKFEAGQSFAVSMKLALEALIGITQLTTKAFLVLNSAITVAMAGLGAALQRINAQIAAALKSIEGFTGLDLKSDKLRIAGEIAIGGITASQSPKPMPGTPESYGQLAAAIRGGSFGTFSSPGASLAGRAGKGIKNEDAKQTALLKQILDRLGVGNQELSGIHEGIDDLEVGFQ